MNGILRLDPGQRMSQGVIYGGLLYTAGQVDGEARDVAGQTRNVLARIDAILANAGASRSHIISANIWLADIAGFEAMNEVWESWIDKTAPPARATVESRLAGPQYQIEVAVVAALPAPG